MIRLVFGLSAAARPPIVPNYGFPGSLIVQYSRILSGGRCANPRGVTAPCVGNPHGVTQSSGVVANAAERRQGGPYYIPGDSEFQNQIIQYCVQASHEGLASENSVKSLKP